MSCSGTPDGPEAFILSSSAHSSISARPTFTQFSSLAFVNIRTGSSVINDPLMLLAAHERESYYRLLGPRLEATEAALVMLISFIAYLTWTDLTDKTVKIFRYTMLIALAATILVSGSRSASLALPTVLICHAILAGGRHPAKLMGYAL